MSNEIACLAGYRVLDLMETGSSLSPKLLGDWGAEVIKVEPPCGSRLRGTGPFYHDSPDSEKSLFWFANNTNKKSITLNIEVEDGRKILKRLVSKADFLFESFSPGYMDDLGLGYASLREINPRLIMTSITPFGQTGPYSWLKARELVAEAMGGIVDTVGEPGRTPVRVTSGSTVSIPCQVAETEAAAGTLIASYNRLVTGKGQQVDVSYQESISNILQRAPFYWDGLKVILKRAGGGLIRAGKGGLLTRREGAFLCKDGYVQANLFMEFVEPLVEWMDSEGAAGDLMANKEHWLKRLSPDADPALSQEEIDHFEGVMRAFFARHTKEEIYRDAEARGIGFGGIVTIGEVLQNQQLKARGFFVPVEVPELGETLICPRPPYLVTGPPPRITRRAPFIGEHNEEIYMGELGFSRSELVLLKEGGVI